MTTGRRTVDSESPDLGRPLEHLDISTYALNLLYEMEYVRTLGALVKKTERDLLRIPGFGPKSLDEVKAALAKWGLELKKQRYDEGR